MADLKSTIINGKLRVTSDANVSGNLEGTTISENGTQLSNKYIQKSSTAGLVKNDGTIDTTTYSASSHTHTVFNNKIAVNPSDGSSFNEGVRINRSTNNWANVVIGGNSGSTEGTGSGVWLVGRRGQAGSKSGGIGDFTIEQNGSTGTGLTLYADGSKPRWNNNVLAYASDIPSVSNATITIKQTGISDQTFTLNGSATTITLADNNTTYTFAEGSTNKAFTVTPSGGSAQTVAIHGLGDASLKGVATAVTSGDSNLVTSGAVFTAIDNLPEPMVFKGTLGTGGTITTLPTAAAANEGFTYKVITAGTYASQAAKVGDVFVSNGSAWVIIPAGDTDSDTWRSIKVNGTEKLGSAISTGAVDFKNGTGITASYDSGIKYSLASAYGDTVNPYGSKTKNYVLAAPNGSNGTPSFRALVAADIPDLSSTYSVTGHTHSAANLISWSGLGTKNNGWNWGYLTTAHEFTQLLGWDEPGGGSVGIAAKGGQISIQVDGEIYVNEGNARLAHVGEAQPASDVSDWAKAASKPSYSASEVGALPSSTTIKAGSSGVDVVQTASWDSTTGTLTLTSTKLSLG